MRRLRRVDHLREDQYHSADLGNLTDPLAELVYIMLSRQTREAVHQVVYDALRSEWPRWIAVLEAPACRLEEVLRPAGFQAQRAAHVKNLLASVEHANRTRSVGPFGTDPSRDLTLDFLSSVSDEKCERFLIDLPGVGPKTARCVMSYSLGRDVFAVDTHVQRVLTRLGLVDQERSKTEHDKFQALVPRSEG